jgi:threonylcarbamoyladenosine tRNA methylthiotransferase MtaB
MSAPLVVTLGCRLNALESEVIGREAAATGLGETVIVNTCAVTAEAVRQARQTIRRLKRQHPTRRIFVTGCAAQLDPGAFARMAEVDRVLGNREKLDQTALAAAETRVSVADIMGVGHAHPAVVDGIAGRTRAYAAVQQGCDHRCTFCIIPYARGPARSVPSAAAIAQVRLLAARGFREVVLTGVDLCSYGRDDVDGLSLGGLVRRILADVPELPRLRLSSLDPAGVDDALFAALAEEPRLMPHWHLSLQAADDLILKRMKRRHTRASVEALVARARRLRPDVAFGADLIAGFPTETEAMFARALAAIEAIGFAFLHVFPFSPRPGTPAARMPQVPRAVREARARALRAAGDRARDRHFANRVGTTVEVLIEADGIGRCPDFSPVRLPVSPAPGSLAPVRLIAADGRSLIGAWPG